jgi:hypothetical protein
MGGHERDLVTGEGVDEGSADSVTETARDRPRDLFAVAGAGTPENGEQRAAPDLVVAGEEDPGPGQRQQVGEG